MSTRRRSSEPTPLYTEIRQPSADADLESDTLSYIGQIADRIRVECGIGAKAEPLVYLVYATLALAKGTDVSAPDVHNAWAAVAEYHRSLHDTAADDADLMPFWSLPARIRAKDERFAEAIRRVAATLGPLGG